MTSCILEVYLATCRHVLLQQCVSLSSMLHNHTISVISMVERMLRPGSLAVLPKSSIGRDDRRIFLPESVSFAEGANVVNSPS